MNLKKTSLLNATLVVAAGIALALATGCASHHCACQHSADGAKAFGTTLDGLYIPGFAATRDFGPFFGFVKAAPAAATLIVADLLARG